VCLELAAELVWCLLWLCGSAACLRVVAGRLCGTSRSSLALLLLDCKVLMHKDWHSCAGWQELRQGHCCDHPSS
jgi:hypothetical protein